jgi:hypothetical protein
LYQQLTSKSEFEADKLFGRREAEAAKRISCFGSRLYILIWDLLKVAPTERFHSCFVF